ncbi:hypothetical protein QUA41_18965 [Microcoleus sp. Pol11C1]
MFECDFFEAIVDPPDRPFGKGKSRGLTVIMIVDCRLSIEEWGMTENYQSLKHGATVAFFWGNWCYWSSI